MFSLIITIISILLVAVLAIASIYFGGTAWNQGGTKAAVTQYFNEGQQIAAAATLYRAENGGRNPESIQVLLDNNYLRVLPEGQWEFGNEIITRGSLNYDQCLLANQMAGYEDVPMCDDPGISGSVRCCEVPE
ncbi:hypothetical protein [Thioalkalivibrio thiocyanodenitrificans]|uniref:hypothetical protein n=1 Tax=Thioalkalivibrio thiocyanodenitrificans TaxID=243063 RepID=UPI00037E77AA|nr:hypothetical protein [Thioalkalivibrio thiocyanodenitrificans]